MERLISNWFRNVRGFASETPVASKNLTLPQNSRRNVVSEAKPWKP